MDCPVTIRFLAFFNICHIVLCVTYGIYVGRWIFRIKLRGHKREYESLMLSVAEILTDLFAREDDKFDEKDQVGERRDFSGVVGCYFKFFFFFGVGSSHFKLVTP